MEWTCGNCGSVQDAAVTACGNCEGRLPVVGLFTATGTWQDGQEAVLLRWEVQDAAWVRIEPLGLAAAASGSLTCTDDLAEAYTLEAGNVIGERRFGAKVRWPAPKIRFFTAVDPVLNLGYPTILTWEAEHAASLEISSGVGDVSGRSFVEAFFQASGPVTLTARNRAGEAAATVLLSLPEPKIPVFEALSPVVPPNGIVSLRWETLDADTVEIDPLPGIVAGQGYAELEVFRSTVFRMTARNASGVCHAECAVTLPAPRILFFESESGISTEGEPVDLAWATEYAHTVVIDPLIGEQAPNGVLRVRPRAHHVTYTLTAIGNSGTVSQQFDIFHFPLPVTFLPITPSLTPMDEHAPHQQGAATDLNQLEQELRRQTREHMRQLQIERAQQLELNEELLALERGHVRSELKRVLRKIKKRLFSQKTS
ncbi:MAG: hypothetical protein NW241_07635 [Bacteroidia bacterium]|nr:hypothetical protein [Bacteroidia bacterium]